MRPRPPSLPFSVLTTLSQAPLSRSPTPRPLTGLELSEDVRSYVTFLTAVPFGPSSPALGDPGLLFLEVPFLTESPGPALSAADTSLSVVWVVNVRVWQSFSGKGQMATL